MPDEMEEIIAEFVTESVETLDKIDPLFVELETKSDDQEILNRLFRSVHTIKGAAGFLGFQSIVEISHNAENIMKKLRDGDIRVSRALMDVVLKSVDMLRLLLGHVRDKDGVQEDTKLLVLELQQALDAAMKTSESAERPEAKGNGQKPEINHPTVDSKPNQGLDRPAASPASEQLQSNATGRSPQPSLATPVPGSALEPAPSGDVPPDKGGTAKSETLQTLRVEVNKIDKVMDLTGEVVLVRNRLLNIVNRLERQYSNDHDVQSLLEAVSFLDLITSDMQLGVIKMRMQPIAKVFNKFPRLVRDISAPLGKTVNLKVFGEDTEVDKSVIEGIGDPMVHIIRNAVDHGLETPAERRAKGKPDEGTISISASQKGNQIVIEVSDNGRGINIDKVKAKALEKKLISDEEAIRMTDDAALNLIFMPGFSTAETATQLSGRGVGMDVVKTNVSKLNGSVEIATFKDKGSTFTIRIPLTLAIIQTLMVRSGNARYAIPLAPVEETLTVSQAEISDMGGSEALVIRGKVYPLFMLSKMLGSEKASYVKDADCKYAVVVAVGDKRFCLGVDELLGQEEVVIKNVSGINTNSSYILGATITGDGKVVFILDLAGISKNAFNLATA